MTLLLPLPWASAPAHSHPAKEQQPPHQEDMSTMALPGHQVQIPMEQRAKRSVGLFHQQDPGTITGVQ